jgi:ferric-dicitrate binding protein FerR (iron transport regulator)
MDVQALGTKFNVKAYSDEKTISATLEEGKINVKIGDKTGKIKTVLLTSKEKLIFFKATETSEVYTESEEETILYKGIKSNPVINAKILTNVQTELYTSWKDNRWIIEGQPLGTLAPLLERRYNLKFVFYNDELKKYKFSGTIEKETVEQILNAMRLTAPLDYRISKDTVELLFDKNFKDKYGKIMTRTN